MTGRDIVQVKRLRTIEELRARLGVLGIADELGVDDSVDPQGPLCTSFSFVDGSTGAHTVGNRFAVLPMEGWDAEPDGRPSDLVRRRWRRFGESGAKLVWGGEAVAVRRDGRANPRQLVLDRATVDDQLSRFGKGRGRRRKLLFSGRVLGHCHVVMSAPRCLIDE